MSNENNSIDTGSGQRARVALDLMLKISEEELANPNSNSKGNDRAYWFDLYSQCYDLAAGNQVSYNETTYNQKVTYVPSFS